MTTTPAPDPCRAMTPSAPRIRAGWRGSSRRWVAPGLILLLLGQPMGSPALAQSGVTAARPGWLPLDVRLGGNLTTSQRATARATLERLLRLLQQVPELANPDGFEIQPVILGGSRPLGPDQVVMDDAVVEQILRLIFYVPSKRVAGAGCGCLEIRVNEQWSGNMFDGKVRDVYAEPARAVDPKRPGILWEVPAATDVYGELWEPSRDIREGRPERSAVDVVFLPAGARPGKPMSREAFYAAALRVIEGPEAELRGHLAKTRYETWMEGAADRRQIREQTLLAYARTQPPAEVEAVRRQLEGTEQEVTEVLRAAEAADRERNREALAASDGRLGRLAAELAQMTPAERSMPTYINDAAAEGPIATGSRLTADPEPPSRRVFTIDHDFWRARRSPVEVRSIRVHIGLSMTGLRPPVRHALLETFKHLDWAAVRLLLETPP